MRYFNITLFFALVMIAGCGKSGVNDPKQNIDEVIAEGWTAFEQGDYSTASNKFGDVLRAEPKNVEANNGLGWTRAFQKNYQNATTPWNTARDVQLDHADVNAGLCIVYNVIDNLSASAAAGERVVAKDPQYVFAHKTSIDIKTVRATMAASYYGLGNYTAAAQQMDVLVPTAAPHSTNQKLLLQAIMDYLGLK